MPLAIAKRSPSVCSRSCRLARASGDYIRVQLEVTLTRGVALEVRSARDCAGDISGACVGPAQPEAANQATAQVPCTALAALEEAVPMYYGTNALKERLSVDLTIRASEYLQMAFLPSDCCPQPSTGGALPPTNNNIAIHRLTVNGVSWNGCKFEYRAVSQGLDSAAGRDLFLHNARWSSLPDPRAGYAFSMTTIGAVSENTVSSITSTLALGAAPLVATGNPESTPGCFGPAAGASGHAGAAVADATQPGGPPADADEEEFLALMQKMKENRQE